MTFIEAMDEVMTWLQHDKCLSYRALKRQCALDDDALEDLQEAHARMIMGDGRGLV